MYALTWSHSHHFWHPVFKLTANRVGAVKIFNYRIWVGHAVLLHNLPADTTSLCDVVFFSCGILHAGAAHVFRQSVLRMRVQVWSQFVRGDFKISRFSNLNHIISADTAAACIDPAGDKILPFADFLAERRLAAANLDGF